MTQISPDLASNAGTRLFSRTFAPITRHQLALYCGASGDTNPIHVDSDFAKAAGFPDVFAHGMLVMAYLGAALEEVVPPASVKSFSTRFAAITQLGAEITCEGTMVDAGDDAIRIKLVARDQNGDVKLKGDAAIDKNSWEKYCEQA